MRLLNASADTNLASPKLTLSLASTQKEVREVQRLRYKVFIESMGLSSPVSYTHLTLPTKRIV